MLLSTGAEINSLSDSQLKTNSLLDGTHMSKRKMNLHFLMFSKTSSPNDTRIIYSPPEQDLSMIADNTRATVS